MQNKKLIAVLAGCLVVLCLCVVVAGVGVVWLNQSGTFEGIAQSLGANPGDNSTVPPPPTGFAQGLRTPLPGATTQVAPPTKIPEASNPLDALTQTFRGLGNVKSFRARIAMAGTPAGAQEMNLEVVLPDRFHMVSKQTEMIILNQAVYIKVAGQWQKMPMTQGIDLSMTDPQKLQTTLGAATDVKLIGAEVLDGTPTMVYQYTTKIGTQPQPFTSKIWVGVSDNLPRKIESESQPGQKTTITFYDYGANIAINPPIP